MGYLESLEEIVGSALETEISKAETYLDAILAGARIAKAVSLVLSAAIQTVASICSDVLPPEKVQEFLLRTAKGELDRWTVGDPDTLRALVSLRASQRGQIQ